MSVGFVIMFVTGALLFASRAVDAYESTYFRIKLGLLMLVSTSFCSTRQSTDSVTRGTQPPRRHRVHAWLVLCHWCSGSESSRPVASWRITSDNVQPYAPYIICLVRIVAGLLFMQHGLEKLFGFAGARPAAHALGDSRSRRDSGGRWGTDACARDLHAADGVHSQWRNGRGVLPILGSARVLPDCERRRGSHPERVDFLVACRSRGRCVESGCAHSREAGPECAGRRVASWEPRVRAILRLIVGFLLTLHGIRKLFDVLPSVAGRRGAPPLALDSLPPFTGYIELAGGVLLMLGLVVRPTALVISVEVLLAYALIAQPRNALANS